MNDSYRKLAAIDPTERVLLLSHCMRPSRNCPGKLTREGLACPEDCDQPCVVGRLRRAALALGYKGVCIASGGSMAVRFVAAHNPRGIVAVACPKELAEGIEAVGGLEANGHGAPAIVAVPLLTDGCIDTTVDEALAQEVIALGSDGSDGGSAR